MALKVYQNQLRMDLIIPGWESTFHLYPGEYVGGEYYTRFSPTLLTDVTDQNIPIEDIKYIYPGSTDGPSEGGAIDAINGVAPIQTSTLAGVTTISLGTLTGSLFGPGEVVKSINSIADTITINDGAGISVDTTTDTITINNTQLGLVATYATPPLYLELGEGNESLTGGIAITPLNSGGAVALQSFADSLVYQDGYAGINGLHISTDNTTLVSNYPEWSFGIYDRSNSDFPLIGINYTGQVHSSQDINTTSGVHAYQLSLYETTTFDPLLGKVDNINKWVDLNGNPGLPTYFDVDVQVRSLLTLGLESYRNPGSYGYLVGHQIPENSASLINLTTSNIISTPLIRVSTGSLVYPNISGVTVFEYLDDDDNSLVKIHDNGEITAKIVNTDTVNTTTLNAETINTNSTFISGPTTLNITTAGPNTIMADCSAGTVVIQLPDLNSFTRSLSVTVIKTDNSNNDVSIVNGLNSTINGSTSAVNLTNQYETITIISNGIKWFKIGAM